MATKGIPIRPREKAQREIRDHIIEPMNHKFYRQTELDLVCRLDKKRRELDREIADFKAKKDDEYRLFERNLKAFYLNTGGLPKEEEEEADLKAESSRRQNTARASSTSAGSHRKENRNHIQHTKNKEAIGASSQPVETLQCAASNSRLKSNPGGSPGPPDPAKVKRQPHEHERELQGVFTPEYLPMLDSKSHDGDRRSSTELLEASNLTNNEPSPANRGNTVVLSSSAEYHHQRTISPPAPPTRPLSASVPQDESIGHRRSSSDSADSNRRSSFRNPKEPRSPKRVLFSIDDTVVSPSTSPVAQRSNSSTPSKTSRSNGSSQGNDSFEIVKGRQGKVSPASSSATAPASLLGAAFSGPSSGWNSEISPLRWAFESENRNKTSSLVGPDDFEHVDREDELFAFDEDLDLVNSGKAKKADAEGLASGEEDAVEDVESQETLVGSSPHAGSLPIEIKWPGKAGSLRNIPP